MHEHEVGECEVAHPFGLHTCEVQVVDPTTVVTPEPVGAVVPLVIVLTLAVMWMRIFRGMPK